MTLPIVNATVIVKNPNWKPDDPGSVENYYIEKKMDVEVLTLNLNAGSMRVRVPGSAPQDIPIEPFAKQYGIVRKGDKFWNWLE